MFRAEKLWLRITCLKSCGPKQSAKRPSQGGRALGAGLPLCCVLSAQVQAHSSQRLLLLHSEANGPSDRTEGLISEPLMLAERDSNRS